MANTQGGVYLTNHLKERFLQRTNKRYKHLQNCRYGEKECEECKKLFTECRIEVRNKGKEIEQEIRQVLAEADEERSYLNNNGFMSWYYDKYGYKRFRFLVHEEKNLLFVCVLERGREVVVTCVKAKTHLVGKAVTRRKKFRKKTEPENVH